MKKKISLRIAIVFLFLLCTSNSQSQTYVKGNVATALLLIPNFGIETSISEKATFQVDLIASFWTIDSRPEKFLIFIPEYRYHFKEKYKGFYLGAHIGCTIFKVSKWDHFEANQFEKGFGALAGATIGYQIKISNKILMDLYLGGGNHQGFYKGYEGKTGERYDHAKDFNKSGEWIIYRGGVMLSYNIN